MVFEVLDEGGEDFFGFTEDAVLDFGEEVG